MSSQGAAIPICRWTDFGGSSSWKEVMKGGYVRHGMAWMAVSTLW